MIIPGKRHKYIGRGKKNNSSHNKKLFKKNPAGKQDQYLFLEAIN